MHRVFVITLFFFQRAYVKIHELITFPNVSPTAEQGFPLIWGSYSDATSTVGGACAPVVWLPSKPRPAPRCSPVAGSGAGSLKTPLATTHSWVE